MNRRKSLSEINRLLGITYQKKHSDRQLHEMYKDYEKLAELSNPARRALMNLGDMLDGNDELMQTVDFDSWLDLQPDKVKEEIRKTSQIMQAFEDTDEGRALKYAGWIK